MPDFITSIVHNPETALSSEVYPVLIETEKRLTIASAWEGNMSFRSHRILAALRVLSAYNARQEGDPHDIAVLKLHARPQEANLPIDELACSLLKKQIQLAHSPQRDRIHKPAGGGGTMASSSCAECDRLWHEYALATTEDRTLSNRLNMAAMYHQFDIVKDLELGVKAAEEKRRQARRSINEHDMTAHPFKASA